VPDLRLDLRRSRRFAGRRHRAWYALGRCAYELDLSGVRARKEDFEMVAI